MAIVIFGIIMVYSSSYLYAKEIFGSSTYFFVRQFLFAIIGGLTAFVVSKTKFHFWIKYAHHINALAIVLLLLTFIPSINVEVKGAHRWIALGGVSFQPGELVKFTLLLASLNYFGNFSYLDKGEKTILAMGMAAPLLLLMGQPDFGSFIICFLLVGFVCYLGPLPKKYFYWIFSGGMALGIFALLSQPYRVQRILTFIDPWQAPQGPGFQIIQSFLAFANGAVWGQGLGNSKEKLFYLPEAHNDFIFSVIGEEFGLIGVLAVVALFIALIYTGFKLSLSVDGLPAFLLISSVVFTLGFQAFLNTGVVLGLLPTKGLNLPFISYGGSSLISNFFGIGLILSACKTCKERSVQRQQRLSLPMR